MGNYGFDNLGPAEAVCELVEHTGDRLLRSPCLGLSAATVNNVSSPS